MNLRNPVFATLSLLALAGCSPATQYRRSALVPAPAALEWDGRTAPKGTLRLEGAASTVGVRENPLPVPGDTAFHVPTVMLHGAAAIAVTNGLELGARYSYGAYGWSHESAVGTAPIPGGGSVSGFGPEIRGTIRLDDKGMFALGIGGNYMFYSVPTAEWERDPSCDNSQSSDCFTDLFTSQIATSYRLQHQGTKSTAAYSLALYPSIAPANGKYGHVFLGLAVHRGFKNDGFSDRSGSAAVEGNGVIPLVGVGYGIKVDMFRVAGMLSVPLTSAESAVDYSTLSGFLVLGVDLPLWAKPSDATTSAAPPATAPANP